MSGFNNGEADLEKKVSHTQDSSGLTQDAVFGEITEQGPNYRNVGAILSTASIVD